MHSEAQRLREEWNSGRTKSGDEAIDLAAELETKVARLKTELERLKIPAPLPNGRWADDPRVTVFSRYFPSLPNDSTLWGFLAELDLHGQGWSAAERARLQATEAVIRYVEQIVSDDFCDSLEASLFARDPPDTAMSESEVRLAAQKFSAIYRATHSVDRAYSCHSVHKDWRAEVQRATQAKGEPGPPVPSGHASVVKVARWCCDCEAIVSVQESGCCSRCGGCHTPGVWINAETGRLEGPTPKKSGTPFRPHIVDGEFQSDKYPTTPRGKVPLSCKDPAAQDLLWMYAQRRRSVDVKFSDDLEFALRSAGYAPVAPGPLVPVHYESNGEAGDGQDVCVNCGAETDDPHTLEMCRKVLEGFIGQGWEAAGIVQEELYALRAGLVKLTEAEPDVDSTELLRMVELEVESEYEHRCAVEEKLRESEAWRSVAPVEMILHCPACGRQHLDIGEFATRVHRKHLCENTTAGEKTGCGHVWKPYEYATKGVTSIETSKSQESLLTDIQSVADSLALDKSLDKATSTLVKCEDLLRCIASEVNEIAAALADFTKATVWHTDDASVEVRKLQQRLREIGQGIR